MSQDAKDQAEKDKTQAFNVWLNNGKDTAKFEAAVKRIITKSKETRGRWATKSLKDLREKYTDPKMLEAVLDDCRRHKRMLHCQMQGEVEEDGKEEEEGDEEEEDGARGGLRLTTARRSP